MTPITLYEGCYVKTANGSIHGPLLTSEDAQKRAVFRCGLLDFWPDGTANDHNLYDTLGDGDVSHDVVAVYAGLSDLSRENPEL